MSKRLGAHARGYTRGWQKARLNFLTQNPLCLYCKQEEKLTRATVVDHSVPHRGDMDLFWDESKWIALWAHHHNSTAQIRDLNGFLPGTEADGNPMDPNHPWNK
jgi:5-methylcytosine-specific restriction endonuclease McrA